MNQVALVTGASTRFGRITTDTDHFANAGAPGGSARSTCPTPPSWTAPNQGAFDAFCQFEDAAGRLSKAQKEEIVHRITSMFAEYFGEAVRPYTMVLIEEVPDGGYGRADEVFVIPDAYRAKD